MLGSVLNCLESTFLLQDLVYLVTSHTVAQSRMPKDPVTTPVFLIYAQRYCTVYMALRPPELEQSSLPPSIPSVTLVGCMASVVTCCTGAMAAEHAAASVTRRRRFLRTQPGRLFGALVARS